MLDFNSYRKQKLESDLVKLSFAEAFDRHFDIAKLDLAVGIDQNLKENTYSELDEIANYAFSIASYEDYTICQKIVNEQINLLQQETAKIIAEAAKALDLRVPTDDVKNLITQQVNKFVQSVRQSIIDAVKASRSGAPGMSSVSQSSSLPAQNISAQTPAPAATASASPQAAAPSEPQKIGIPDRRGFWGWLKNMVNPTAWKNWFKGREGMNKVRDLMAHDPKFANLVNKRWGNKFQYESFQPMAQLFEEAASQQLNTLTSRIDELGKKLLKFLHYSIDNYAQNTAKAYQSSSSTPTPVTPTGPTPIDPIQPTKPPTNPTAPSSPTSAAVTKDATPEEPSVAPEEKVAAFDATSARPPYENLGSEDVLGKLKATRGAFIRQNGISERQILKDTGTGSGQRKLLDLAKSLGYPGKLTVSTRMQSDDWLDVARYVINGLKHTGLLKEKGQDIPTATHVGRNVAPEIAPEPTVAAPAPEKAIESPKASYKDRSVDYEHPSMLDPVLLRIMDALNEKGQTNEDDNFKALQYYWDKLGLKSLDSSKVDKYVDDVNDILKGHENFSTRLADIPTSKPEKTPTEEPEVSAEPAVEPESVPAPKPSMRDMINARKKKVV